jgi:hypothetical protein
MTRTTGWLGNDEPDGQAPQPRGTGGFTGFILANRADPGQGRTLGEVLQRAGQAPDRGGPEPQDPDDRMAAMVTRGYSPGLISQLSQRLADTSAELEAERGKLEAGARRAEYLHRAHEAGRLTAWQVMEQLGDEGDETEVRRLERRAASLRQQIDAAAEAIAPPERRDLDPLEAAAQRAHAAFAEHTRALVAAAEARQARRPAARPFAGRGLAVRSEVTCAECIKVGATPEQSVLIHQDPDAPIEAQFVDLSEQTLAAFGRQDQAEAERRARGYRELVR